MTAALSLTDSSTTQVEIDEPALTGAPSAAEVDELVRSNMALVGYLVRELINRLPSHIGRDELVSAGMFGLVVSARSYDPSRGVPFARFAAIRIRGALTDELRSMDWASRGVRGKARELHAVRTELSTTLGRTPSRDEVAQSMGVGTRDVDAVDADVQRASVLSLHALTSDAADDMLPIPNDGPEDLLIKREQLGYLHDAVEELPSRLQTVVRQYFFEGRTMNHIAAELGVTESRVSQLRSEALTMLRAGLNAAEVAETTCEPKASGRRRAATQEAYCAAVTTRSTVSARLRTTTLLGDPIARPALRLA